MEIFEGPGHLCACLHSLNVPIDPARVTHTGNSAVELSQVGEIDTIFTEAIQQALLQ